MSHRQLAALLASCVLAPAIIAGCATQSTDQVAANSATPSLASYFDTTGRTDTYAGGVRMIPITTPKGTFNVFGKPVSPSDVTLPLCAIACETDHIAHWKGSFNGVRQMGSTDKTFVLAQSGHIAGIINPPSKGKYGHYTSGPPQGEAADWLATATFHQGSWWPRWRDWLAERSGPQVAPPVPQTVLCAAPGTYVKAAPAV